MRNIITKYWWYRDQHSIAQRSNEREFVWTTNSTTFVMSPEDSDLPCKWEDVARITTYDNNGNVLRDLFYPNSYNSEFLCRFIDGTGSGSPRIIKTRIMYFVPPEPEGKDGAAIEPTVAPIGLPIVRPPVENRNIGWCTHNGNLCHTAYTAGNFGYPSTIAGFL